MYVRTNEALGRNTKSRIAIAPANGKKRPYEAFRMANVLGIGQYDGEKRYGPDGRLYQWVQGVDGLGNSVGFWDYSKFVKQAKKATGRAVQTGQRFVQCSTRAGKIDAKKAVKRNPYHAEHKGWGKKLKQIQQLIFAKATPHEKDFAYAVARWQCAAGLKSVDGIIGKNTWARMHSALRSAHAKGAPLPSPWEPLPTSLEPALKQAVSRFRRLVYTRRKLKLKYRYGWRTIRRLLCFLGKVLEPGVDDRYILLWKICTPIGTAPEWAWGPTGVTLTGCIAGSEAKLRYIKTKNDVDNSSLFKYLKPDLLHLHLNNLSSKQDKFVVEQLLLLGNSVVATSRRLNTIHATFELASGALAPPGTTPGRMPRPYGIILDWLYDRYKNPKSIYSCL